MIMMIIATSFLFGSVLTNLYIAQTLAQDIVALEVNRWVIMLADQRSAAGARVFSAAGGHHPDHLPRSSIPSSRGWGSTRSGSASIMTLNLEAGLITPPVGLNLYVVQGVAPDIPMATVLKGVDPVHLAPARRDRDPVRLPRASPPGCRPA